MEVGREHHPILELVPWEAITTTADAWLDGLASWSGGTKLLSLNEHDLEPGDAFEVRVRGDHGQVSLQRRGRNQRVNVTNESGPVGRPKPEADFRIPLDDPVCQKCG